MICTVCNKEFNSKRKDAKFCSSTCRSNKFRATDNPNAVATDNATDKPNAVATDKVTAKDSWLCKICGCNLINMPGHDGMCIYHWRQSENTIPEKEYNLLNTGNPC